MIISTETDEGEMQWTTPKRFAVVLSKHIEISKTYAYERNGKRQVKPITVFYCPTQNNARTRSEEFIRFLAKYIIIIISIFTYKYKKVVGYRDIPVSRTECKDELTINGTIEKICKSIYIRTAKEEIVE